MQALRTLTLRPANAARLVAARPRTVMAVPARRLTCAAPRAQAEEETPKDVPAVPPAAGGSSAVAPRGTLEMMPSWSRMNQVGGGGCGEAGCCRWCGRRWAPSRVG